MRFDPDAAPGQRLRVWDRIEGDLVERAVEDDRTPCQTLALQWVVGDDERVGASLRVARDPAGGELLPTPDEERPKQEQRVAEEARRATEEYHRAAQEARARLEAEQRIAELEAKLRELTAKREG